MAEERVFVARMLAAEAAVFAARMLAAEAAALPTRMLAAEAAAFVARMLAAEGLSAEAVGRADETDLPSATATLESGAVDLVINIPRTFDERGRPDGYEIRRRAVDLGISLITDLELARLFVQALQRHNDDDLIPAPWGGYFGR